MWNSRGLRGSTFENLINITNDVYRKKNLAIIQKTPTPITPVKLEGKNITLAYFDQKSTVDYIGVVQGIAVCFDAKETGQKSLPIQNIHAHQIAFMNDFEKQRGLAFLLVHFTFCDEYFYLPFTTLNEFWNGAVNENKRKSIPYDAFDRRYLIRYGGGSILDYLSAVNIYLVERE